jgi:hypothetical protein
LLLECGHEIEFNCTREDAFSYLDSKAGITKTCRFIISHRDQRVVKATMESKNNNIYKTRYFSKLLPDEVLDTTQYTKLIEGYGNNLRKIVRNTVGGMCRFCGKEEDDLGYCDCMLYAAC